MIVIFVFADLCVAIGIIIGFALSYSLRVKWKEPKGVNYGIPQQPSVPPMPKRLPEQDEVYKLSFYEQSKRKYGHSRDAEKGGILKYEKNTYTV